MYKGITFALGACLIWGLIFVIPQFMGTFSAIEITMGRYSVYGMLSLLIFFRKKESCKYPLAIWGRAIYFSLAATFGYYICLILSLRYTSPAVSTMILSIAPITISLYGNLKEREIRFQKLLFPSLLILAGLAIINVPHFQGNPSSSYFLGLLLCLGSLSAWTWYVVANSRFLKDHPEVSFSNWTTLVGVATLFWVFCFGSFSTLFFPKEFALERLLQPGSSLTQFLLWSSILGVCCSWVGAFFWNQASFRLPVSLAGQLTIFETIFGLTFVYMYEKRFPSPLESLGVMLLLTAVFYGITAAKPEKEKEEIKNESSTDNK